MANAARRLARSGLLLSAAVLLLSGAGGGCARGPKREAASLDWLTGCWEGKVKKGGFMEERWGRPAGGSVLGTSRIVRDGETVHVEFLLLEERGDSLVLTVHPLGQAPLAMGLRTLKKSEALFADPEHDFPQEIRYTRKGETLEIRAEGRVDGKKRELHYKLKKAPCD